VLGHFGLQLRNHGLERLALLHQPRPLQRLHGGFLPVQSTCEPRGYSRQPLSPRSRTVCRSVWPLRWRAARASSNRTNPQVAGLVRRHRRSDIGLDIAVFDVGGDGLGVGDHIFDIEHLGYLGRAKGAPLRPRSLLHRPERRHQPTHDVTLAQEQQLLFLSRDHPDRGGFWHTLDLHQRLACELLLQSRQLSRQRQHQDHAVAGPSKPRCVAWRRGNGGLHRRLCGQKGQGCRRQIAAADQCQPRWPAQTLGQGRLQGGELLARVAVRDHGDQYMTPHPVGETRRLPAATCAPLVPAVPPTTQRPRLAFV
jgi:hypothetical protein